MAGAGAAETAVTPVGVMGVVVQGMSVSIDGAGVVAVGRGLGPSFSRRKAGAQCVVSNRGGERM